MDDKIKEAMLHNNVAKITPAMPIPAYLAKKIDMGMFNTTIIGDSIKDSLIFPEPLMKLTKGLVKSMVPIDIAIIKESNVGTDTFPLSQK